MILPNNEMNEPPPCANTHFKLGNSLKTPPKIKE